MPVTSLLPDRTEDNPPPPTRTTMGSNDSNKAAMEDTANQHFIIGDNLRHKAFYDDAIEEFQRALHIQEPLLGSDSEVVAKTHYCLGLSLRAVKDFKQALYHLKKAGETYHSCDPKKYADQIKDCKLNMARAHHSTGVEFQRAGDYDRSIVEHHKALAIRENILGRNHLETARTYYVLGCALSDRGDFDEALAELRRALRTRLLVFGRDHMDSKEVINNLGVVLHARGAMTQEEIEEYKAVVLQSLSFETEGDNLCRKGEYEDGMVCYRKGLSIEEQMLGDLHPTTCDLYLRMADAMGEVGDLEASLVEYKSAILIYERMMGKFHVKVANIYNKLAGILMEKGEYEVALSFFAKAYGIYDSILGNHDDTKQAMMNLRLAAAKERNAKKSLGLLKKADEQFEERKKKADENNRKRANKNKKKKDKGKDEKGEDKGPPKEEDLAPEEADII